MTEDIMISKFRPISLDEVIGQLTVVRRLKRYVEVSNMPHCMFSGDPGIGKTSSAHALFHELYGERWQDNVLELNASDERGIDTIRYKVKNFAMTKSSNNKFKIVFLDEGDYLTKDAQTSLRNLMETYSKNCRFIITGNFTNKFVEAIVSRCVMVEFAPPEKTKIEERILYIANKENIKISTVVISKLVNRFYPDIRKCINTLQELSNLNREITIVDIKKEEMLVEQLFARLKQQKFMDARQILLDNNVDYEILLLDFYNWIYKTSMDSNKKIKIIQYITDCSKYMSSVISKELLFADFMIKVIGVLK